MPTSLHLPVSRHHWSTVVLLTLVAALANLWPLPVTTFLSVVVGPLFILLLLPRAGLGQLLLASLVSSLTLWFGFGHLWGALLFGAEAAVVWWLTRRGYPLLLADLLYWIALGMPLTLLILRLVVHAAPEYQLHMVLKQGANGVSLAALAVLLLALPPLARRLGALRCGLQGFRQRLSQLVFSVLLAAMLIGGVAVESSVLRDHRQAIEAELDASASGLSQRYEMQFRRLQALMSGVAALVRDDAGPEDLTPYLTAVHHAFPELLSVLLADGNGRVILGSPLARWQPLLDAGRHSVADREYFQQAVSSGQPFLSNVFPSRGFSQDLIVALAVPVTSHGRTAGIIQASMTMDQLYRALGEAKPQLALLVDRSGQVVVASQPLGLASASPFTPVELKQAATLFFMPALRFRPGGEIYLYQQRQLSNGWSLYTLRNYGDELAVMYQRYRLVGLVALLLVPLGWLLALVFARSVAQPLEALTRSVRQLGQALPEPAVAWSNSPREIAALADAMAERHAEIARLHRDMQATLDHRTSEISAARNLLAHILDAIPVRLFWKDAQGRYQGGNRQFAADAGVADTSQLVGLTDQDLPWSRDAARYRQQDQALLAGEPPLLAVVERQHDRQGGYRWLEVSKVALSTASGEINGVLGVYQEVTERIRHERELVAAKTAAEGATKAKSAFLANMSHEIRTPLNAIVGLVDLVLGAPLDEQQRQRLLAVQRASDHLLRVISDVLDYSKIEAGHLNLHQAPFNPAELITELEGIFRPSAEAKGLQLRVESSAPAPLLIGDATRLRQVLSNLLSNAIKFTPSGEVSLALSLAAAGAGLCTLEVTVRDSGIGISAADQAQLFQPFSQLDDGLTRAQGGTGLGLSISRQLMELMGGELQCTSSPGQGSCFRVLLTLAVDGTGSSQASADSQIRLDGLQLLVVEDNLINQEVARGMLERAGATVVTAANGAEAVDWLARQPADLVLMDLQMPVMDGYEATRLIRTELGLRLPVVALTANAQSEEVARATAAGMDDYLTKPVRPQQLLATVARLCRQSSDAATLTAPALAPPLAFNLSEALARCGQERALLDRLLARFRQEWPAQLPQLATALAAADWSLVAHHSHSLKGVAANLAMTPLALAARALEQAARRQQPDEAQQALIQLQRLMVQLLPQLPVAEQPQRSAHAIDGEALPRLRRRLQQFEVIPPHELDAALAALSGQAVDLAALRQAIEGLDYPLAMQLLAALVVEPADG